MNGPTPEEETRSSGNEIPTEIKLDESNYKSIRIERGEIVLELTNEAAESLHQAGFTEGWNDDGK